MSYLFNYARPPGFIAKGSLAELQTQLEIAREIKYITQNTFNDLEQECIIIGKMLGSLIKARSPNPSPITHYPSLFSVPLW